MIWGFDQGKFYIDFVSCSRLAGNMRQESDRRAIDLAQSGAKHMLCFSGGLDSQAVLHSFYTQGIPLETAFMYCPGFNDNELEQVKILDKKYGIKTHVIDIDVMSMKDEIIATAERLDIHARNNVLQAKFVGMLPDNYDIIQMVHDPYVYVSPKNKHYYCIGKYFPEITRPIAFADLNRTGKIIAYGDTPEFLLSIIGDEIFKAAFAAAPYFDGNGLTSTTKNLKSVDRWDYYIKPIIYGKYWRDELIYFPKFAGNEYIEYLQVPDDKKLTIRKHAVYMPYYEMLDFLATPGSIVKRIYENVPLVLEEDEKK